MPGNNGVAFAESLGKFPVDLVCLSPVRLARHAMIVPAAEPHSVAAVIYPENIWVFVGEPLGSGARRCREYCLDSV